MKKKIWAWLMTLVMIVTMVPATAFAAEDTAAESPYTVTNQDAIQPAETGGVYLNKQLDLNENGEGTITLQTYVEGSVHTTAKPVDFVLVLDMSTSMKEQFSGSQTVYNEVFTLDKSKTYYVRGYYGYTEVEWCDNCNAWTNGCSWFLGHIAGTAYEPRTAAGGEGTQFYTRTTVASMTRLEALKSAASNFVTTVASEDGDHRIALVGFEDEAHYLTGGTAATAFRDASENETSIKNIISGISNNDLEPATEHGKGLAYAENIFAADTTADRERVVIMFTDGEPEPNGSGNWSSSIVSGAVNSAYDLKNTHNASVYCISVLPGADPDGTANMDKYINYVSSNYKEAQYTGNYSGTNQANIIAAITPGEGTYGGKYYQVAADLENLNEIFGSISSDVQSIQLDEETVITDVMSKYFKVNGVAGDVQLYVSDYTGKDSNGTDQFGEQKAAEGVTAAINGGVVSVDGFDFEPVIDNEDGTAKSGKMLTIVVPVKLDQEAVKGMSDETVPSNNTENAKAAIVNDGETVAEFAVPAVTLPKEKIVITAASAEKTYDGAALTNAGYTYTEGVLAEGDVLTAVVAGSQTDAGEATNTVTSFRVMRGETDVTDKYDISTVNGALKVNKREVVLTSATDSKVYDGTPLTNSTVTVGGEGFANGEGASYNVTGSQLDPGSSKNAFSYTLNENTKADNYNISTVEGDLTVTKITEQLLITADSSTKMYDGEELTDDGYTFTDNVLAAGDELVVEIEGSQTDVGETENVVKSYKVMRGNKDVTENYTIATANGKLAVTKRPVVLTSATDSKVYDGKALTNDEITVSGEGFVKGEGAAYNVTGSQLDVGTSNNTFTYELNNGTKAGNYEITVVTGTLTVTPVKTKLIIQANSNTKMYDGEALTDDGYTYTEKVLAEGDKLVVEVEGSQTDVGETENVVKSYKVMRGETDVTKNYTIATADGKLTVTKRPVTLTSATDSKVYDGTPLTNDNVTVSGEGFVKGEGAAYNVTGSQLDAGSSNNTFTYELNEGTKAGNYSITTVQGTLTVTPVAKEIVIKADSNTKVYDGKALTDDGYTFTKDVLIDGDVLTAVVEGEQTNVGTAVNVVKSYKVMRGEDDVTGNYTFVESVDGTLKVTPRPVTLTSATDSKVYDGTPLTNDKVTVSGEGFVEGEGASYDVTGSQLDVGSSSNTFKYTLNEGTLAENYTITTKEGTLTVTPVTKEIVITADSNTKMYDGEALTDDGYTFTKDVLIDGDVLTAVVEGERTNAGTSANKVTSYKVMRGNTDVTENYTIRTAEGTLTVTQRPVTLTSATDSKVYDGKALTNDEITVGGEGFVKGEGAAYNVTGSQLDVGSSENQFTYELKEGTLADNYVITTATGTLTVTPVETEIIIQADSNTKVYDGTPLTDDGYTYTEKVLADGDVLTAVVEGSQTDAGDTANKVTSYKVMRGETDVTKNYKIATADGKLTVTKRTVTMTSGTAEKVYDGKALTNDEIVVGGEGFVDGEGATYDVTGSQLDVGSSDNEFTYELNEGTKADNYEITTEEGTLTVTPVAKEIVIKADSNTKMYDGEALTDDGYSYTEDVLVKGDKLIAVVEGTQTDAGKSPNKVTSYKVMRGEDDVTGNYTFGESVDGTLEVTPRPVTLTSGTAEKVYDGEPLTNDKVTVSGEGFVEGEGASYDVTGSQTNVGSSENTFTYTLNEGTKAGNYIIKTVNGKLTVTPVTAEIVITADSAEKVYDGKELTDNGYTFTEDVLVKGDVLTAVVEGTQTDAGESANVVTSYKVMRGDVDVTNNYTFGESVDGTLKVTPRPVTLTSGSAEKEYDGKPLTNDEITVGGEKFVDGEGVTFDVTGSQLDVGSSANTFTYEFNEGTNAKNYEITTEEGTLTVTKAAGEIVVTADSNTKVYDGTALTADGYTFDESKLKNGDVLTAVVEGSQTDAGTADNTVTKVVIMRGDKDVTANYNIATANGTLTVTKRPVTLTSATDSKVYDGTPLTNDEITVGGEGFAEGEGAAYDVTGSQLDAGSSDNTFTYALNEGTKADNYEITTATGTLTVTPVGTEIIIQADSNTKMYDGTPLTDDGYTFTEGVLVEGDELVAVVEGSQTNTGESVNTVTSYKVMRGEEDVTANYKIAAADGKLTVNPRVITLTSAIETKFYDGTPLTNDEITVSGDDFAAGEGLVYKVTGTVTNVAEGAVANEFTYEAAAGTDLNNYKITTAFGTLEIAPVKLIVTADDQSKVQGEENPELTGTITGFVNGETAETALTGDAEYTTTAEKDSEAGEYPITAGQGTLEAVNGNYIFEFVDGTLTVTEKPVPPAEPEEPTKPEPPAAEPEEPDDNAQTGDDFNFWMYAGIAFMALISAIAAFARRQRQQ